MYFWAKVGFKPQCSTIKDGIKKERIFSFRGSCAGHRFAQIPAEWKEKRERSLLKVTESGTLFANRLLAKFLSCLFACVLFIFGGFCAANATCTSNQIDINDDGSVCENVKFSLTTLSVSTLGFKISASGTFYVDCGDNGTLTGSADPTDITNGNTITRSGTGIETYTCTWASSGEHTIRFGGLATGYSSGNTVTAMQSVSIRKITQVPHIQTKLLR